MSKRKLTVMSLDKWTEEIHKSDYFIAYSSEFLQSWTPYSLDIKDYLEGKLEIHCHVGIGSAESIDCERCLIYDRVGCSEHGLQFDWSDWSREIVLEARKETSPDQDGAVFIAIVDGSEMRERLIPVRSRTRLLPLDECSDWSTEGSNASLDALPVSISIRDWKHKSRFVRRGIDAAFANSDGKNDMVETIAEVITEIPDDGPPPGIRWGVEFNPDRYLRRISIVLKRDGIAIRIPNGFEGLLQFLQVFFSHAQLGVNASEELRYTTTVMRGRR